MTLRLTAENLPAAYSYLRATQPFARWRLPEADDIEFKVTRELKTAGYFWHEPLQIAVSERAVGSTIRLMEVMAHEMLHLHQHLSKTASPRASHNADFARLVRRVCVHHNFDPMAFGGAA